MPRTENKNGLTFPLGGGVVMTQEIVSAKLKLGVVGGLGPLASADVFFKLVQATPASTDADHFDVIFEQHPFRKSGLESIATTERKLYIFDMIRDFERRGVTTVVLPCFLSHTFITELKANTTLQIVDIVEAVRNHVRRKFPRANRIGVLASTYTRNERLFERYFTSPEFEIVHPRQHEGIDLVNEAVYGSDGIKSGSLRGRPVLLLRQACEDLIKQGVQIIVPGMTELALVADQIGHLSVPMIDANSVYARYVVSGRYEIPKPVFKIGIVGGVGPAATVDFLQEIVRHTPAKRDQDHIRLLVEHNPQIPDRTEHLIAGGADPTISLYATCKKLEEGDADIIAIPCNTAHAFVERIQPYLAIPIVNMLTVTVRLLREMFPTLRCVGLLATSGTLESRVYEKELALQGFGQVVPDEALQVRVMESIYGEFGVKAGFTDGQCQEDITAAVEGLIARGVEVIILGCTELPLLLPATEFIGRDGACVKLINPTSVLAQHCVHHALSATQLSRSSDFKQAPSTV